MTVVSFGAFNKKTMWLHLSLGKVNLETTLEGAYM